MPKLKQICCRYCGNELRYPELHWNHEVAGGDADVAVCVHHMETEEQQAYLRFVGIIRDELGESL